MPIDLTAAPTNKLLLEVGPEGTREVGGCYTRLSIPLNRQNDNWQRWRLELHEARKSGIWKGARMAALLCEVKCEEAGRWVGGIKQIGQVSNLGEVVALYELLSQKKWPGTDQTAAPEST